MNDVTVFQCCHHIWIWINNSKNVTLRNVNVWPYFHLERGLVTHLTFPKSIIFELLIQIWWQHWKNVTSFMDVSLASTAVLLLLHWLLLVTNYFPYAVSSLIFYYLPLQSSIKLVDTECNPTLSGRTPLRSYLSWRIIEFLWHFWECEPINWWVADEVRSIFSTSAKCRTQTKVTSIHLWHQLSVSVYIPAFNANKMFNGQTKCFWDSELKLRPFSDPRFVRKIWSQAYE